MRNFYFQMTREQKFFLSLFLIVCASSSSFAQGAGAITNAANAIQSYWGPVKTLINVVGAVVGLVGGLRIYNKWTSGDQDINKVILGWGGACLFLFLVPTFVAAFFGIR